MIQADVFTNQDYVSCIVNKFVAIPHVGDSVRVNFKGKPAFSKVASVKHDVRYDGTPYVEIELWSPSLHTKN